MAKGLLQAQDGNRLFPTSDETPGIDPLTATFLPRLGVRHLPNKMQEEAQMKYAYALLARIRLFARKSEGPDAFDLRLQRIGTRERRRQVKPLLFRGLPQAQEA